MYLLNLLTCNCYECLLISNETNQFFISKKLIEEGNQIWNSISKLIYSYFLETNTSSRQRL